ncbi:MAG TPA: hypothetical protein VIO60_06975 [Rectinemataceae bacterium]
MLATILGLGTSCANIWEGGKAALRLDFFMGEGFSLERSVGYGSTRRAILPQASWEPRGYSVVLSGPGGASQTAQSNDSTLELLLIPGSWIIEVQALSESGVAVAAGRAECVLKPNSSMAVRVGMAPLTGTGSLELSFALSLPGCEGGRFSGILRYLGIPGADPQPAQADIPFDLPTGSTTFTREEIQAGHYALELRYTDDSGQVLSGLADTVLILAGYITQGQCVVQVEIPELSMSLDFLPWEPLDAPCIGIPAYVPRDSPIACLAQYSPGYPDLGMSGSWYINGIPSGEAVPAPTGLFPRYPHGTVAMISGAFAETSRKLRVDFLENSVSRRRAGSASTTAMVADPNSYGPFAWLASYPRTALASASVYGGLPIPEPGIPYRIKALAASDSGIVAVSGFDEEGSIHLFASPFTETGPGAAFLRLWKGKIRVDGSLRTADRLAVSTDGRYVAASSSASDWLWILRLDEEGNPQSERVITKSTPGFSLLDNARAICFSGEDEDTRLIALCSGTKSVLVIDASVDPPLLQAVVPLDPENTLGALGLQDIEGLPSGAVVASAADASALFVLGDVIGRGWSLIELIHRRDSSDPLYKPGSIAVAPSTSGFYVLCDKKRVLRYGFGNEVLFELEASFELASEAVGSTALAARLIEPGERDWIALAGGGSIISCWDSSQPGTVYALRPNPDLADMGSSDGIAEADCLCSKGEVFLLGGGDASVISVFGIKSAAAP